MGRSQMILTGVETIYNGISNGKITVNAEALSDFRVGTGTHDAGFRVTSNSDFQTTVTQFLYQNVSITKPNEKD